jgi:S-formylglutathione hydrolase FrmB
MIGYYVGGTVWDRLAEDVVGPARKRGYQQVWLAGISMGGMGSLMYARHHPGELSGVMAMAPYLGDGTLVKRIRQDGGLAHWKAPPRAIIVKEDNYQAELWRWLQAVTRGAEPGPPLYLGFGRGDRLAPAAQLLAAELPADHVFETPGGHAWGPWAEQWTAFLDHSAFATACAP